VKQQKYFVSYRGKQIGVPFPFRKNVCVACGKSVVRGQIKTTQMHHTKYAYSVRTVRKHPELALENTLELDFYCHRVADAIRMLVDCGNPDRIQMVLEAHCPKDRERFIKLIEDSLQ